MSRVTRRVGPVRIDWFAFLGLASGCVFALLGAAGATLWMFIAAAVLTLVAGVCFAILGKDHAAAPSEPQSSSRAESASPSVVAKGKRSIASWINTGTQNTGDRRGP
jgi:hypothetical protein